jgi:hypothetical protein
MDTQPKKTLASSKESPDALLARLEAVVKAKNEAKKKQELKKKDEETNEKLMVYYGKILVNAGYTDGNQIVTNKSFYFENAKNIASKLDDFFGKSRSKYYSHTLDDTSPEDAIKLAGSKAWNLFSKRYNFLPPRGHSVLGTKGGKTTLFS